MLLYYGKHDQQQTRCSFAVVCCRVAAVVLHSSKVNMAEYQDYLHIVQWVLH